jgi:hypothetical protein
VCEGVLAILLLATLVGGVLSALAWALAQAVLRPLS